MDTAGKSFEASLTSQLGDKGEVRAKKKLRRPYSPITSHHRFAGELTARREKSEFGGLRMKMNIVIAVGCAFIGFAAAAKIGRLLGWNRYFASAEIIAELHDSTSPLAHNASDARKFYVALSGTDSNSGLMQQVPLRTIQHAAE